MRITKPTLLLAGLALVAAACGGGDETEIVPTNPNPGADGAVAGACLEGEPDCEDTLVAGPDEEPIDLDADGNPIPGLSVRNVLADDPDGGFAIRAYYFETSDGTFLCDAIAESFPPQCGGDRIPVDNSAGVEIAPLETEGEVTWSPDQVILVGEVIDGTFVLTPVSE